MARETHDPVPDGDTGKKRPVQARVLRVDDLIDLRIEAPNCKLRPKKAPTNIVAGADALLILHFPPQHIAESVLDAVKEHVPENGDVSTATEPADLPATVHRAAAPSRLVFEVPKGTQIPFTVEGVLAAASTLVLKVSPNATPAPGPDGPPKPTGPAPKPPAADETAIEAPYRLIVSPSELGAFQHPLLPAVTAEDGGKRTRVELWHSRLTVRPDKDGTVDDTQRIVRAVWTPDKEDPNATTDPWGLTSLTPKDRNAIVEQTSGRTASAAATPLTVKDFALSTLGAWVDWTGSWDVNSDVVDYRHIATMGRDGYVRVVYPGFLFPFGHRAVLVKVTERRVAFRGTPVARLWQRFFIVIKQPTRTYDDADNPFTSVTLSPIVTPDLDAPPAGSFVPNRGGTPYVFALTTIDKSGTGGGFAAPLIFVRTDRNEETGQVTIEDEATISLDYQGRPGPYGPLNIIPGLAQQVAMATPVKHGDTAVEVTHLVFDGDIDDVNITSRPHLTTVRGIVPAMRHLAPQAPAVDLTYAKPYLAHGLPAPGGPPVAGNAGELVLALTSASAAVDFSGGSDRSGGFIAPNLQVRALSRSLGAVGDNGDPTSPGGGPALNAGRFDPTTFLQGALPKLFGLFSLLELLDDVGLGLDRAPSFISQALDVKNNVLAQAQTLTDAIQQAQTRMTTEVANSAHAGAAAIAGAAQNALDTSAGTVVPATQAVVDAVTALTANPTPTQLGDLHTKLDGLNSALGDLGDNLALPGFPAAVRSAIQKPITALQGLVSTVAGIVGTAAQLSQFVDGLLQPAGAGTARMEWHPVIKAWDLSADVPNVFKPNDPTNGMTLAVEVQASASAPPVIDVLAELAAFELNLIGDGKGALMQLSFQRIGFHAGSNGKPEIDVVFGGLQFLGPLAFVDVLRSLIPFDGFSDPPFVDIEPDGATAGFDIALPNVGIGVFSLENISLGADARIPFLGDAVTVGFHFCAKESPFRLTVMCIGGGGWVGLRASPKGMVLLEIGLEAAASLAIDLGVASGSVSVAVGVYLRLEDTGGSLTGYFRIRGQVEVLGLVSASITLELSLKYEFDTGKLVGRASLVVDVEVLFFSASVEITCERRLAGSKGDPTLRQIMPPDLFTGSNDDWAEYCAAFAPIPV
jgi:hypothetical protein